MPSRTCNKGKHKGFYLKKLVTTISSCGVTFSIWQKRNPDGKGSWTYDWTSLMENEKKKLLSILPDKLKDVIQNETVKDIQKEKTYFEIHWQTVNFVPLKFQCFPRLCLREWINLFTSLSDKRQGYKVENVTCYMHAAAYDPSMMVQ
ncbi:uncharacterized protein LOC141863128 [Acropora palmata]|uniref:uncharacterized protein LOC141863128 n=1 Tax=Acropora palmata TaxID=6131 RepID=UPI003DA18015